MADILNIIQGVLRTAQQVSAAIPGASVASPLLGVAASLTSIIDQLTSSAPDARTRDQMRAERAALAAAVSAKAERTADRFDGN